MLFALMGLTLGSPSYARAAPAPSASDVTFRLMTCEYLENPLGIDVATPRLSWRETSNTKGYAQKAYRILVASSPSLLDADKGDVCDSGKVQSSQTNLIDFHGRALTSRMRCWWKVQAWDREGRRSAWSKPATFTMGLLSSQDWRASWIGINDTQTSDTQRAILAGARWIWFPDSGQPSNAAPLGGRFFRVSVSLPAGRPIKRAQFVGTADNEFTLYVNGQKVGGGDNWKRVQTIDVAKLLRGGRNDLAVKAVNASDNTQPSPAGFLGALKIEYQDGGAPTVVTSNANWKSSDTESVGWSGDGYDDSAWRMAIDLGADGMGPWGMVPPNGLSSDVSGETPPLPARYLRREFQSTKQVAHATAYVCGMGFFQLYINGKAATDHVMDPALSDYRKAAYYVTTDVTKLVRNGANVVGVTLGNGRFYSPRLIVPIATEYYGTPRVLMQLEITYTDGARQTIISDKNWKISDKGPIRANNEYDGETYDARMALKGWSAPGFAEAPGQWTNADIVKAPTSVLEAQMIEPMRVTEVVHPVGVTSPKPGVYIVDMGRTFYGTVRLSARAKRGATVQMTSGYEVLRDGMLKTADNRSAKATDIYTFAGTGLETWSPTFKGQGFRRIQVTGFPGTLTASN
ncbi:MAG: inverting alpha-L-rhamnosidase, partial [Capsulimonas sp.]|nr:inverting alpha-L-rhamnosidase [Capsulimonas sp.]